MENTTSPGDVSPGFLGAGQSNKGSFPQLKQTWSWFTPGLWIVRGPRSKSFSYHIDITAKDENGHTYPLVSTIPLLVIVEVSGAKATAGALAEGSAASAVVLLALAAAAVASLVGLFGPAEALLVAAGAAYAVASGAGLVALDPPEPDPAFQQRVFAPDAPRPDFAFPPDLRPLALLLKTIGQVMSISTLLSTIEGRWLGALAANELNWAQVQAQDFSQARTTLAQRAASAPKLYANAVPGLLPIVQPLLPSLNQARQNLLVQGIPSALLQGTALPPEILGGLNLVARSTELAYPTVDLFASLAEAVRLTTQFGLEIAQRSLGTEKVSGTRTDHSRG